MIDIMENQKELSNLLQCSDVLLLDRGFRDCVSFLEDNDLVVKMPVLLGRNQKQLTTLEANLSRIVTKFRFAVEIINGFFKRSFKALREV